MQNERKHRLVATAVDMVVRPEGAEEEPNANDHGVKFLFSTKENGAICAHLEINDKRETFSKGIVKLIRKQKMEGPESHTKKV